MLVNSDDFRISGDKLEEEWLKHSVLYWGYSEKSAQAIKKRDLIREDIDQHRAELDRKIRKDPKKYGIEKVTEGAITAAITIDEKSIGLNSSLIDANEAVNRVSGAVKALEHKKRALEKLVELWLAGYYSEPRIKGGGEEKLQEKIQEKRTGLQREGLNRTRTRKK